MTESSSRMPAHEPVPKAVKLTRYAFGAAGVLGLVYIVLGQVELDHFRAGYVAATQYVGSDDVANVWKPIREFTDLTIAIGVITATTMLPFAAFAGRARDWMRIVLILISVLVGVLALIVMMSDASTLLTGQVFQPRGFVTPDDAARASAEIIAPWFPSVHYITVFAFLAAGVVGVVALPGSGTREYIRRHDRVATDDPRIWSLRAVRNGSSTPEPPST